MVDAGYGWSEFLDRYLFHWMPSKAIWIGGQTLSWDARCAGIYLGFALGVLYQLSAGRVAWRMPSARFLAVTVFLMLPLFADVFAIHTGLKAPSNDTRLLTGLLWGEAFSLSLLPAVMNLFHPLGREENWLVSLKLFAPLPAIGIAAFVLKAWDNTIAYGILETLCIVGFLSLLVILSAGLVKTVRTLALMRGVAGLVAPVVLLIMLAGCVTPTRTVRTGPCDERDFVPSPTACLDCKQEVCRDGKVLLVEDLTATAPVDDWAEERFCLRHPFKCYQAYELKQKLERWQKDLVGTYWADEGLHNGLGDAARHAYFMCELTERFGEAFARALGVTHEEDSEYLILVRMGIPGNPCCEKASDLYNNEIGISLAWKPGSCEEKALRSLHLLRHSQCRTKDRIMER